MLNHLPSDALTSLPAAPPEALHAATKMLEDMPREIGWRHSSLLDHARATSGDYARSSAMLDHSDFKRLFLDNTARGREFGHGTYNLLQKWSPGNEPSLTSILLRAADHFNMSEKDRTMLAVAGVLGSEETNLDYHNAAHNRKVVLMALRLATASKDLTSHDVAKILTAAAIHDLGHDGKGNMENGVHVPYRLEKQSFELAKPYLERAGVTTSDLDDIKTMIHGTDVSPLGNPAAPARRVAEGKEYPPELSRLDGNERLLKSTRMLAIADIACSSSLDPEQTKSETLNVARETGKDTSKMTDADITGFYDFFAKACGSILETIPEARDVYGDNHKEIHNRLHMAAKQPCGR